MRAPLVLLTALLVLPASALAWGDGCEFKADRAGGVDAAGVEKVVIRAGAGDMKVVGLTTANRIEARGVACAAKQKLLDESDISVRREGNVVYVETKLPQDMNGWSFGVNEYAYIDLGVALPAGVPVEAIDSSGDATFEDLKALQLQDSSGDLEIRRIAGLVDLTDSSGDIEIEKVGSAKLRDSSGDIDVNGVAGEMVIVNDSSGDIVIANVEGNARIESDSSGGIRAEDVKGSFTVDSDSSGDIYAARIGGDFTVTSDSSGDIDHSDVKGKVTIPEDKT